MFKLIAVPGTMTALALVYIYSATSIKVPPFGGPVNATVFPYLLGICLILASILSFVERRKALVKMAAEPAAGSGDGDRQSYLTVGGVVVWTIAYALVFERLGYIISTSLYLSGMCLYFYRGNRMVAVVSSVGFAVVMYIVMSKLLGLSLPAGPLF